MEQRIHTLKTREQTVQSILAVRGQNGNRQSWDKVAAHFDVSKPCVWRLVNEPDYNPGIKNCEKLGMQHYVEIQACPDCGQGHAVGWCTARYGSPRKPRNSRPKRKRTPPIRIGEATEEELEAIKAVTPDQRRQAILEYIRQMED